MVSMRVALRGSSVLLAAALASAPSAPRAATVPVCQGGRFHCGAVKIVAAPPPAGTQAAPPAGFGAADIAAAYNLDITRASKVTVAVISAYGYPAVETDLAAYRTQYGLPACTIASGCLTVVNQEGKTSPLPSPPPANNDWTVSAALELDMVSAACPSCKLLLVEANDDQGDGLLTNQAIAAGLGATVIDNEWGSAEDANTPASDASFNLPGVSVLAEAGFGYDSGPGPIFPASSEYVIGVSNSHLVKDLGTTRGWTETANNDSGSLCSTNIAMPAYQQQIVTNCAKRAGADVAAVGAGDSPVLVYNQGSGGLTPIAGGATGVAAGIVALEGRAGVGPGFFYQNAQLLYDITSGTDGTCGNVLCIAATGWDGPTGNGALNGHALASASPPDAGTPADGGHPTGTGGAAGATAGTGGNAGSSGGAAGSSGGAAGGGGMAGAAGGHATAGTGGAGGSTNAGTAGTSGPTKAGGSSGCGCAVGPEQGSPRGLVLLALTATTLVLRRRRRR